MSLKSPLSFMVLYSILMISSPPYLIIYKIKSIKDGIEYNTTPDAYITLYIFLYKQTLLDVLWHLITEYSYFTS